AKRICLREKRRGRDLDITQVASVIRIMGDILFDEQMKGKISYLTWCSISYSQAKKRAKTAWNKVQRENRRKR
ncbi:MAG: hypothetical protein ACREN0_02165, partial [Thermodesulfobacteriota bacterium]